MYCSWIGKICIFVTMINSQDKILQKTERMIYFSYNVFMSASSIKRKSTLLPREATQKFYIQIGDNISGQETFEKMLSRLQIRDASYTCGSLTNFLENENE